MEYETEILKAYDDDANRTVLEHAYAATKYSLETNDIEASIHTSEWLIEVASRIKFGAKIRKAIQRDQRIKNSAPYLFQVKGGEH
jgi:hypothetical protein